MWVIVFLERLSDIPVGPMLRPREGTVFIFIFFQSDNDLAENGPGGKSRDSTNSDVSFFLSCGTYW